MALLPYTQRTVTERRGGRGGRDDRGPRGPRPDRDGDVEEKTLADVVGYDIDAKPHDNPEVVEVEEVELVEVEAGE